MAYRIRNNGHGAQGIHTLDRGLVFIPAGEERTLDPADIGRVRRLDTLEVTELDAHVPAPPKELVDKFDHDGDGHPGGSLKATAKAAPAKRRVKRRKRRAKAKP